MSVRDDELASSEGLRVYVEILRRGGVVACPTETFVGLLADAAQPAAIERVLAIKRRPASMTMATLIPDLAALDRLAEPLDPRVRSLAEAHWPGPLTLLVRARPDVHPALVRDGLVGVRIPGASPAALLVRAMGCALTATSANRSGAPAVASTDALEPTLRAEVDAVVPGSSPGGLASTLLDVSVWPPRVVRRGAVIVVEATGADPTSR